MTSSFFSFPTLSSPLSLHPLPPPPSASLLPSSSFSHSFSSLHTFSCPSSSSLLPFSLPPPSPILLLPFLLLFLIPSLTPSSASSPSSPSLSCPASLAQVLWYLRQGTVVSATSYGSSALPPRSVSAMEPGELESQQIAPSFVSSPFCSVHHCTHSSRVSMREVCTVWTFSYWEPRVHDDKILWTFSPSMMGKSVGYIITFPL